MLKTERSASRITIASTEWLFNVHVKSSTQPGVKPIRRRLIVKARHSSAEYGVTDTEGVFGVVVQDAEGEQYKLYL